MPNFKEFIKGFEEKPEAEQPKTQEVKAEQPQPKEQPKPQNKGGYFKPLSKEEKKTATEKGLTDDEYRYKQAQDWAILMNEPIPEKNEFMKGLEENRKAQQPKQPKEGSFEQAFNDMSKPEQGLGDFNPTERIEEYNDSHGAKTHSEREFNVYAGNDRGMYDYIRKNRDYLYRKANSDPQGAIADILAHSKSGASHIKPENIRKDYAMEVLKDFYEENGEKAPDLAKPEEFKPTEKIEEFNDYYGAKTASERNFNLFTGNDRGMYNYIVENRDALAKEAEYDPQNVFRKIVMHGTRPSWEYRGDMTPENIRKDYLINVIKGIVED